jgi:DNA-binding CsgD family transcriptional regulator/tetratricopeptide (TPR) repeat protein
MLEFESIITSIERDLSLERCKAVLPRLLTLAGTDTLAKTRSYLLGAKCAYLAQDYDEYELLFLQAEEVARQGPPEAKARVLLLEASLLTAVGNCAESEEKLRAILPDLRDYSAEIQGLALSILGRNQISEGAYVEAIDNSHEAIALSPPLSSTAAFANRTIATVFQAMGRNIESEHYALEQLRIMKERGSTQWIPGIYSFLSYGAAESKDFEKARYYSQKAGELASSSGSASVSKTTSLLWHAGSCLEDSEYDLAKKLICEAIEAAKQERNDALLMNAYLHLGEVCYKLGEYEQALAALSIVLDRSHLSGDGQMLLLYRWLAETYKALDRKAEAFDICFKLWELQADFDNRTREALLRYHKALEEKVYAQKTAMLNMRTAQMERELAMSATQLVAQVDLLGRFRNDLREIVRQSRSDDPALKQVKDKLKELPCEQIDWVNFDAQFSSVHPEFKSKLQEKHPDLTRSETKICALSRMKLTSEEIGRLLCLSERTVQTHRLNIRKKLGLKTEQNLSTYLASL